MLTEESERKRKAQELKKLNARLNELQPQVSISQPIQVNPNIEEYETAQTVETIEETIEKLKQKQKQLKQQTSYKQLTKRDYLFIYGSICCLWILTLMILTIMILQR